MESNRARGALVEALRLARGLTQKDLADMTGIPQPTLSKVESGADPGDERWVALSNILGVPRTAFEVIDDVLEPVEIFHRKQRTTPQGAVTKVGAEIALVRRRVRDLFGDTASSLKHYDLDDGFVTPQDIAQYVRRDLTLGAGPIPNLVAVLENAGATVVRWPLESVQMDAAAAWPRGNAPVILIGEHVSPERQRFTMAHELGHAVMHVGGHIDEAQTSHEREADAFAGELLIPRVALVQEWPRNPTQELLIELKRRWGVSLAALIRRALDTGLITEDQYRAWNITLSTTGMHRWEPSPLPREEPMALGRAIESAMQQGASVEELASKAQMTTAEFVSTFAHQKELHS